MKTCINLCRRVFFSEIFLFIVCVGLFLVVQISETQGGDMLYAIDPWKHMYFMEHGESHDFFSSYLPLAYQDYAISYPSIMRSGAFLFWQASGVDALEIFQFGGFVLRMCLFGTILLFVRRFFLASNNRGLTVLLLVGALMATHSLFWHRLWIFFPENLVLIFHVWSLYFLLEYLENKKIQSVILLCVFLIFSLYTHIPSSIMLIPILGIFGVHVLWFSENKYIFRRILLVGGGACILLLPLFSAFMDQFLHQVQNNIGANTQLYGAASRFEPAGWLEYVRKFHSPPVFLFAWLGCILILFQRHKNFYPLLIVFLFAFLVSRGRGAFLNIPTNRAQAFFMPYLFLLASLFLVMLLSQFRHVYSRILLSFLLIVIFVLQIPHILHNMHPWMMFSTRESSAILRYSQEYSGDNVSYFLPAGSILEQIRITPSDNIRIYGDIPYDLETWDWIFMKRMCPVGEYDLLIESIDTAVYQRR